MATVPPAPDSPEARRAANKVRSLFFGIAVANIVVFAIFLWQNRTTKNGADGIAGMEAVVARAVAAYNSQDEEVFLSSFSALSSPQANRVFFATTVRGIYIRDFGKATASTLIPSMTKADRDGGTLVYDVRCEKRGQARLVAKFVREMNGMKLIEWRIERPQ